MISDQTSNTVTSYQIDPAIEIARDLRAHLNSVILGEPPGVGELHGLLKAGMATISNLAFLPIDAAAEARFEKLIVAKRGPVKKLSLKAK